MVQREGGEKSNQDQELYILIKDDTAEENAILQMQALKKQHVMINPFFRKVSSLALIPQAKLNYTAGHLQVTVKAIE